VQRDSYGQYVLDRKLVRRRRLILIYIEPVRPANDRLWPLAEK
jgi:hypothetical protein